MTELPPDTSARPPARDYQDAIAEEIEKTLPDGPSPKGEPNRTSGRLLLGAGASAIIATVVFLFIKGGTAAGLVGIVFLFLYLFLASTPWWAGAFRARDQHEVRTIIRDETPRQEVRPPRPV